MRPRRRKRSTEILTLFLFLSFLSSPVSADEPIIKSDSDERNYDFFVMPNKLRVLMVSDPETDKAAVSMDVLAGSRNDPERREGLAHFLEHMLFLGTEKYPEPGEYRTFITSHGGTQNAYTSFEHTNYYFDIDPAYLKPALDRFAQFFAAPLFSSEYVAREKNAVHSEYRSKLKSDWWRTLDVKKQLVNEKHPFANFSIGSLGTLANYADSNVRDALTAFYQRHYSANVMALVVLGKEPLPLLKQWVVSKFSSIPNRETIPNTNAVALFRDGQLPLRVNIRPRKETKSISLIFPIPSIRTHYLCKPWRYIAYLLGHEGKGGLLSYLEHVGWGRGLRAGIDINHLQEATFIVSIDVTEKGLSRVYDIASLVLQYVHLIRNSGISQAIFEEQQRLSYIDFRFAERAAPIKYVSKIARNLQYYPAAHVLSGPITMEEYRPTLISKYLSFLDPRNMLLIVTAKRTNVDRKTAWFGTPYKVEKLSPDLFFQSYQANASEMLRVPERNVFIPSDLTVQKTEDDAKHPRLIKQAEGYQLWHLHDNVNGLPHADFYFSVRSKVANNSPQHSILTSVYIELVRDSLNEILYGAKLAGLDYKIYKHVRGFSVRISGFSDKQDIVLQLIAKELRTPSIDIRRFERAKGNVVRALSNRRFKKPYKQTISELASLLIRPYWTEREQIAAARSLTTEDLRWFVPDLLRKVSVVALAHGNVSRVEALAMSEILKQQLCQKAMPESVPNGRVIKLKAGGSSVRQLQIDHPDSAVAVYFQGVDKRDHNKAQFSLLTHLVSAPFYQELRTERQLGYVVFSTPMSLLGTPGITFVVQSPSVDPLTLEQHVQEFITHYKATLEVMTAEQFEHHKENAVYHLLQKEDTLKERSNRYWRAINREDYDFDSRARIAKVLGKITKKEFTEFYHNSLIANNRKRLVVRSVGTGHEIPLPLRNKEVNREIIVDRNVFAKDRDYFS